MLDTIKDSVGRMSDSASSSIGSMGHGEGAVARAIEEQTAKLPSDVFLWAAGASILGSLALQVMGKREVSNFVGQWVPTLLVLGVYNKIVKTMGHD